MVSKEILQRFMRDTYYTMALGLAVSAMVAFAVENIPLLSHIFLGFPMFFLSIFAPAIFVWLGVRRDRIERMETRKIVTGFFAYAAAMAISFTAVFGIFAQGLMGPMFLVAALAFAAAALFGQAAGRPIGRLDSLLVMVVAGALCLFGAAQLLHMGVFQIIMGAVVLCCFTGIAAWEEHILRETLDHGLDLNDPLRLSVTGAFIMYMGFIGFFEVLWSLSPGKKRQR